MKYLKTILAIIYPILIILLLLNNCKGCNREEDKIGKIDKPTPRPPRPEPKPDPDPKPPVPIKETFSADVVMCMDCSGSMDKLIDAIKNNALNFYSDIKSECRAQGKDVRSMRIRVIAFSDLRDTQPFQLSDFFKLPDQENEYKDFVSNNIKMQNGYDKPERGYDAILKAMKSDWSTEPDVRKVIILWTDAPSHPLIGRTPDASGIDEMTDIWKNEMGNNKRLILFAPTETSWSQIESNWPNAVRHNVEEGSGLIDINYDEILKTLSESI